jgi:hypothetical protein
VINERDVRKALRAELGDPQWKSEATEELLVAEVREAVLAGATVNQAIAIVSVVAAAVMDEYSAT